MDPKTEVLRERDDEGGDYVYMAGDFENVLQVSDIVAGNTYRWANASLVPDPEGRLLALVTHRGEKAPPRLEALPIGTRVRRGAGWFPKEYGYPEDCGDIGTVVALADDPNMPYRVQWDGRTWWLHSRDCLEVVSLPEAEPAMPVNHVDSAGRPFPKDAILGNPESVAYAGLGTSPPVECVPVSTIDTKPDYRALLPKHMCESPERGHILAASSSHR